MNRPGGGIGVAAGGGRPVAAVGAVGQPSSRARLDLAREMLRRAGALMDRIENPDAPAAASSAGEAASSSPSSSSSPTGGDAPPAATPRPESGDPNPPPPSQRPSVSLGGVQFAAAPPANAMGVPLGTIQISATSSSPSGGEGGVQGGQGQLPAGLAQAISGIVQVAIYLPHLPVQCSLQVSCLRPLFREPYRDLSTQPPRPAAEAGSLLTRPASGCPSRASPCSPRCGWTPSAWTPPAVRSSTTTTTGGPGPRRGRPGPQEALRPKDRPARRVTPAGAAPPLHPSSSNNNSNSNSSSQSWSTLPPGRWPT